MLAEAGSKFDDNRRDSPEFGPNLVFAQIGPILVESSAKSGQLVSSQDHRTVHDFIYIDYDSSATRGDTTQFSGTRLEENTQFSGGVICLKCMGWSLGATGEKLLFPRPPEGGRENTDKFPGTKLEEHTRFSGGAIRET